MTVNPLDQEKLPKLPKPAYPGREGPFNIVKGLCSTARPDYYTAEQMQQYARDTLASLRPAAGGEADGWSIEKCGDTWHIRYTPPAHPAPAARDAVGEDDYSYGIQFIKKNVYALLDLTHGPSERYVVERTVALLAAAPPPQAKPQEDGCPKCGAEWPASQCACECATPPAAPADVSGVAVPVHMTPAEVAAAPAGSGREVDEAMIERAMGACVHHGAYFAPETAEEWRAALRAALKGEGR